MKHFIKQNDDDKLFVEIDKVLTPTLYRIKFARQYKNEEPEIKMEAFLSHAELNNFIESLQTYKILQKTSYPLNTNEPMV